MRLRTPSRRACSSRRPARRRVDGSALRCAITATVSRRRRSTTSSAPLSARRARAGPPRSGRSPRFWASKRRRGCYSNHFRGTTIMPKKVLSQGASPMQDRIAYQGITFDDVLLEPGYSDVVPRDADVRTQLTRNIRLNIPVVSSPMDTVTESELAIALAQEGGIGVIHKNMSIPQQTREVDKVKRS